jgi:pimeloyl-ACP methyl ester carboxylesterase
MDMAKLLRWLGVTLLVFAGLAIAAALWMRLEFGPRPPETVKPLAVASDVRFVEANGMRFAYLEAGKGPLVLLFHGYPETARSWSAVQRKVAGAGYRVVAPFMRGYPPTSLAADGDYGAATLGRDVIGLIDALGADSAVVVGHDWGALAVYSAVAQKPEKISKLVAIAIPHARGIGRDPKVFMEAPHFLYYQLPWARRLVWSRDFAHIERIYAHWAPTFDPPADVLEDIKATLRAPGAIDGALGYYWSLFRADSAEAERAARSSVSVPSLIIVGAADGTVNNKRFDQARPAFTGPYTFLALEGAGHFPQLEAPDRIADAIVAFLATK